MTALLITVGLAVLFGPHSIAAAQFAFGHFQNIAADLSSIAFGLGMGGMMIGEIAPFPTVPELLAVKMSYKNGLLVADEVMPRINISKQKFQYSYFDKGEIFRIPNTQVGRTSAPNRVELSASTATDTCEAHGLDYPVPQDDIDNAPANYDPLAIATAQLAKWIALDREVRVAGIAFSAGTYGANNKTALTGNHKWDVVHADSDPVEDISTGLEACTIRPNNMVIGRKVFSRLQRHAFILESIGNITGKGIATRKQIADLFELDNIFVGESFINTAKKGQATVLSRTWGNHCLLYFRDPSLLTLDDGITFAFTAQWKQVAGSMPDKSIGLSGGQMVRAGEYVAEHVMAADCAYYIADCVS
jgi:hypothetical protein